MNQDLYGPEESFLWTKAPDGTRNFSSVTPTLHIFFSIFVMQKEMKGMSNPKNHTEMANEKIIVKKSFFHDFIATTESNYNARVQDVNKMWNFDKKNGFEEIQDVVDYLEKHFHIDRENIVVIEE